jgi:glyoxylase I family protein
MSDLEIHHVSVITTDLERSAAFYENVLELQRIPRPPFKSVGIWYGLGTLQIHVIVHPEGTFRGERGIDNDDVHFALRTRDFDRFLARLNGLGWPRTIPGTFWSGRAAWPAFRNCS